jgi:predicted NBD/HSP70 family sugar kinase
VCREFDQRVAALSAPNDVLQAITTLTDRSAKFKAILDATESEPICDDIITAVIHTIAEEISKLIQILQPTLLIIGGALTHLPPGLRVYMEKSVRNRLPPLINNHLVVRYAIMAGARMAAVGAVHRFLQRYEME